MSSTARMPSSPSQSGRKTSSTTDNQVSPGSARNPPHSQNPSANGVGRSPSVSQSPTPVSARAAARRPGAGRSNLSMSSVPRSNGVENNQGDDDARAETAAVIDDLKEQVNKAETVSEQYRKQLGVLQLRLDEAVSEQGKWEEQAQEKDRTASSLQEEVKQLSRRLREMEHTHQTELASVMKDKEHQTIKEEELQCTIQRLKETIAQKDPRMNVDSERNLSRSSSFRNRSTDGESEQFAPSSQLQRSPSRNNSKLILQKDKLIESLRLELAEAQIKLVEMENQGGGRQQDLEKELLDARMANARLMEDNESYQLLLSEKTLNGDFTKADVMNGPGPDVESTGAGGGSLADELESADASEDGESRRKLENEVKSLKDQNKALALYIERIIGRLLQHEGFEHILDKSDNPASNAAKSAVNKDKELPPPPAKSASTGQNFLQRARSVVSGQSMRPRPQQPQEQQRPLPKPRPVSQLIQPSTSESQQPTTNEDPTTAPRIPIGRSRTVHSRTRSDQVEGPAATVAGQMYRGSAGRSPSAGALGPGHESSSPEQSSHNTVAGSSETAKRASVAARSSSGQSHDRVMSSSGSMMSDRSGEVMSTAGTSSPPRSSAGMNNYTGAVMTQNKLRPLRLVRENQEENEHQGSERPAEDDEVLRKKANRGSWIPWFNQPKKPEVPDA